MLEKRTTRAAQDTIPPQGAHEAEPRDAGSPR